LAQWRIQRLCGNFQKTMKILIIDPHYSTFLDNFYLKNPEAAKKSYDAQKEMLFEECFGTANFYSLNLKKIGKKCKAKISFSDQHIFIPIYHFISFYLHHSPTLSYICTEFILILKETKCF